MGIAAREGLRVERERREKEERRKMGRETEREMHANARLLRWCDCPVCFDSPPGNKEGENVVLAIDGEEEALGKCACSHCEGHMESDIDQQRQQQTGLTQKILAHGQTFQSSSKKPRELGARETVALHRSLLSWCDCVYCKDEPSMRPGAPPPAPSTQPEPVQDIASLTAVDISTEVKNIRRSGETIVKRHQRILGRCGCLHCNIGTSYLG